MLIYRSSVSWYWYLPFHVWCCLSEPKLFHGYDPKHKIFNLEIELIHDLEPLEVTDADAKKFKKEHGDKW